jgi:hypothetical protein
MSPPITIVLASAHKLFKPAIPFEPSKSQSSKRTCGLIRNTSSLSVPNLSISTVVLTKPFSPCFQEASLFWQELAMINLFVMIIVVSISSLTQGY